MFQIFRYLGCWYQLGYNLLVEAEKCVRVRRERLAERAGVLRDSRHGETIDMGYQPVAEFPSGRELHHQCLHSASTTDVRRV